MGQRHFAMHVVFDGPRKKRRDLVHIQLPVALVMEAVKFGTFQAQVAYRALGGFGIFGKALVGLVGHELKGWLWCFKKRAKIPN